MADSLLNTIFAVVDFVFDLSETIDRTKRLSKPDIVEVPRALAEAEERARAAQAASGTDQAS